MHANRPGLGGGQRDRGKTEMTRFRSRRSRRKTAPVDSDSNRAAAIMLSVKVTLLVYLQREAARLCLSEL